MAQQALFLPVYHGNNQLEGAAREKQPLYFRCAGTVLFAPLNCCFGDHSFDQ
jgi:hypothetical protein